MPEATLLNDSNSEEGESFVQSTVLEFSASSVYCN